MIDGDRIRFAEKGTWTNRLALVTNHTKHNPDGPSPKMAPSANHGYLPTPRQYSCRIAQLAIPPPVHL